MSVLTFSRGDQEILKLPFPEGVLRIGRHPSNDLTLPEDEISRHHCRFEWKEGKLWMTDQSRNGTRVNGRKITSSLIGKGDLVKIGPWKIVYQEDSSEKKTPKETTLHKPSRSVPSFHGMIGQSPLMQKVFEEIEKVAPTEAAVVILGETGTGKELVAQAFHRLSLRKEAPFIPLNCSAISPHLIESELFGHERGAFTGAIGRHPGAFEQAEGGTIFLDEIGELPLEMQPKLLRVLEEGRFRRVGGIQEIHINVRVIAATHRNLEAFVQEGKFREDLFFRLYTVPIFLPSLRERSSDIPFLAEYFLRRVQPPEEGKTFSPEAIQRLVSHPWKGNVRELKNVITRSLLLAPGDLIQAEDIRISSEDLEERPLLQSVERQAIVSALKENEWNKNRTARALAMAKSTLFYKIKEYRIKESA